MYVQSATCWFKAQMFDECDTETWAQGHLNIKVCVPMWAHVCCDHQCMSVEVDKHLAHTIAY